LKHKEVLIKQTPNRNNNNTNTNTKPTPPTSTPKPTNPTNISRNKQTKNNLIWYKVK
jgi:hypothetical protein